MAVHAGVAPHVDVALDVGACISFGFHTAYGVGGAGTISLWSQHPPGITSASVMPFGMRCYKQPPATSPPFAKNLVRGGSVSTTQEFSSVIAEGVRWDVVPNFGDLNAHASATEFHHRALAWDAAGACYYIDGVLVQSYPAIGPPSSFDEFSLLTVGCDTSGVVVGTAYAGYTAGHSFNGKTADLILFNAALTASEVRSVMTRSAMPASMVARWRFPASGLSVPLTGGSGNAGTVSTHCTLSGATFPAPRDPA